MRFLLMLPCGLLATPAEAAQLATGSAPDIPWLRLLIALAVSTTVAAAAIFALRRKPGSAGPLVKFFQNLRSAPPRRIFILETRRASQHGDLCLVEVEDAVYLLALTTSGATLLYRRELSGDRAAGAPE